MAPHTLVPGQILILCASFGLESPHLASQNLQSVQQTVHYGGHIMSFLLRYYETAPNNACIIFTCLSLFSIQSCRPIPV